MRISEIYKSKESIVYEKINSLSYPWDALDLIFSWIFEIGEELSDDYKRISDDIWIHNTAIISPTACITGPCIIDEGTEIRHSAFIRGSVIVGKNTVVGNSVELKNSILFNNVEVPHFNYVGDSILGFHSHLGAGAITSNVKSDRTTVKIKFSDNTVIDTNRKKVGAFLGDYVEIGSNSVLNPGVIIYPNTRVYPLSSVRGVIGANRIYKNKNEIDPLQLT